MRKAILVIGMLAMIISCSMQGSYTITGDVEGFEGQVMLMTLDQAGEYAAADSADVTDGKFLLTGSVQSPHMARMTFNGKRSPEFFIENSAMTVTGHADSLMKLKFEGSSAQAILDGVTEELSAFSPRMRDISAKYREADANGDEKAKEKLLAEYDEITAGQNKIQLAAVTENSGNAVGPYFVYRRLRYSMELDSMKAVATGFSGKGAKNIYAKLLNDYIAVLETVAIGQIAPDFEMEDPDGNMIKLSDFRGKYLLIDFWASWCGPCRRENPNVSALYQKVRGKNFDILGVSLDTSREGWLKAIDDDVLNWSHVSDLKGWDNRVAKLYGVSSIPHTVLLDPDGKILEKNLRGEELRERVMEIVNM